MNNSEFRIPDFESDLNPEAEDPKSEEETSNVRPQTSKFSLYLHIPFCRNLCPFCHFYRLPEVPDWRLYLDALKRELDAISRRVKGPVRTLYVGGGTPTLLPPEFHAGFFGAVRERFGTVQMEEATIETDGGVGTEVLACLAGSGFNRISFGIKSFSARTRDVLRTGKPILAEPVAAARSAGFSSVGLDLVYGIMGQNLEDHVSDVMRAISLDPDHLSLYALEENGGAGPRQADPDESAAMFLASRRILIENGFQQYEITNFAKPGKRCIHNQVYWRDGDYLGLGPSAHSSVTMGEVRIRWWNRPETRLYLENPEGCREELSREGGADRAKEALILGLRMTEGVRRRLFSLRYCFDPVELLKPHFRDLVDLGLLRSSTERIRLTTRGMLLSNEVFVRVL